MTPPVEVVKNELVALGVRYQLVTSETSFVAVERWLDGRLGDAAVATPLPSASQQGGDKDELDLSNKLSAPNQLIRRKKGSSSVAPTIALSPRCDSVGV